MPHKAGFSFHDNPYSNEGFFNICEDYEIPHDPMRYKDEKFCGTCQHGGWSDYASVRSRIIGNIASMLTAQKAFLNNFENIVNRRVDIREDIKRYQNTLSYASSKVDYRMGENI